MRKLASTDCEPRAAMVAPATLQRKAASGAAPGRRSGTSSTTIPAAATRPPSTSPRSRFRMRKSRENFGSSGNRPSTMAKTFANTPNTRAWYPTSIARLAWTTVRVPGGVSGHPRPKRAASITTKPRANKTTPGTTNSQRGLTVRNSRSVRHPSLNERRCGRRRRRPSGCSVIGSSAMRPPYRLDRMIISVANSMPTHRWSSRR